MCAGYRSVWINSYAGCSTVALEYSRCTVLQPWDVCGVHYQGTKIGAGYSNGALVEVIIGQYCSF